MEWPAGDGPLPPPTLHTVLILHHDYTSPASAIAVLRLQRLADRGAKVSFSGFEVLPLDTVLPVTLDVLAELQRLAPLASELGLRLERPASRPPTVAAHIVGELAEAVGLGAAWRDACYRAYWEEGAQLGDETVLVELAARCGLDAERAAAALADPATRGRSRRRSSSARSRGVGGVPVLEVDGALVPGLLDERTLAELAATAG